MKAQACNITTKNGTALFHTPKTTLRFFKNTVQTFTEQTMYISI